MKKYFSSTIILLGVTAFVIFLIWNHYSGFREGTPTQENNRLVNASSPEILPALNKVPDPSDTVTPTPKSTSFAHLLDAIEKAWHVERVNASKDPQYYQRSRARKTFSRVKRVLKALRREGLRGDDLFYAAENQLAEKYGPEILDFLDRYRLLDKELKELDKASLSKEEEFEAIHEARLAAFGPELADMLFFEDEAYKRQQFAEKDILEDTSLTPEEQQKAIRKNREEYKVKMASKGTAVSFGDERQAELNNKLRERYGAIAETWSPQERKDATWEMYREEMPPAVIESAEKIIAKQTARKLAARRYYREREQITNNPLLSDEEKQDMLREARNRLLVKK